MRRYDAEFCRDEHGEFVRVAMRHGKTLLVDLCDWPLVQAHGWYVSHHSSDRWYVFRKRGPGEPPGAQTIRLHRVILQLEGSDSRVADHRDGDGCNNRRNNLRVATSTQNNWNSRIVDKPRRSGFRGVFKSHGSSRWWASISHEGTRFNLGTFATPAEAAAAYDAEAIRLRGEFAVINGAAGVKITEAQ